jgi:ParB family chromosome partitioning protein
MKLVTSFVPLQKIKPTASRWNFLPTELEAAAQLVLSLEGVINPLILRQEINSQSYAVLDGNFEYYAIAHAHQLDAQCCTAVEAFIVAPENETAIQQQIALFRRISAPRPLLDWQHHAKPDNHQSEFEHPEGHSQPSSLIHQLNHASAAVLLQQIKQIGIVGRNAEKIVAAIIQERQRQPFHFLKEVVNRIKGLSYEKMIDLVEINRVEIEA